MKCHFNVCFEVWHLEVVKYLLENGADINAKNDYDKTALDLAKTEEIEEVLRKAGAK